MTDALKFRAVVARNGVKMWQVSAGLGISPQSLYNKLGNKTPFTQIELMYFRDMFKDVTDEEFKAIFLANKIASQVI